MDTFDWVKPTDISDRRRKRDGMPYNASIESVELNAKWDYPNTVLRKSQIEQDGLFRGCISVHSIY
jgi:hypothetical protein